MTTAINRNTLQYYGGTPRSLPSGTWILNPDMSSVSGVALCYWKIIGDSVLEMDSGEKEVVDIQEKLHITYGRNRKKVAIGIYPFEKIKNPIRFLAKTVLPAPIVIPMETLL